MAQEIRAISLDGSVNKLTWDYIDEEAHKLGFNDRSKFVVYCIEKVLFGKNLEKRYLIEIIILCLVSISFILLIAIFMGV